MQGLVDLILNPTLDSIELFNVRRSPKRKQEKQYAPDPPQ